MSIQRTVEIQCPSCGAQQQVQLYEVINAAGACLKRSTHA